MINLWISRYKIEEELKLEEMVTCLEKNIINAYIDNIYILDECDDKLPKNKKIKRFVVVNRPTYNDFFKFINRFTPNDINIIANSDIYFDNTIGYCKFINDNDCFALSRYEETIIHDDPKVSQDVWIFKNKIRDVDGNFNLGHFGCDNKIAYEIKKAGYDILNPCLDIKSHHVHKSSRTWQDTQQQLPQPHLYVEESHIFINEEQLSFDFEG